MIDYVSGRGGWMSFMMDGTGWMHRLFSPCRGSQKETDSPQGLMAWDFYFWGKWNRGGGGGNNTGLAWERHYLPFLRRMQ